MNALLAAATVSDSRTHQIGSGFVMKLCSVGNPDFRQFYDEGVLSPTLTVEAPTLALLRDLQQAYIAAYDLGGGNWPGGSVYFHNVEVARISYNGRVWTPFRFGDPRCKEINPTTGEILP